MNAYSRLKQGEKSKYSLSNDILTDISKTTNIGNMNLSCRNFEIKLVKKKWLKVPVSAI